MRVFECQIKVISPRELLPVLASMLLFLHLLLLTLPGRAKTRNYAFRMSAPQGALQGFKVIKSTPMLVHWRFSKFLTVCVFAQIYM